MALTEDIIKQNEALKELTPEVIGAIVTLSVNDEKRVIDEKTGSIYGGIDKDVLEVTGIAKENGEKTFNYVKRVISSVKDGAKEVDTLRTEIEGHKKKIQELSEKGADPATAQRIKDLQAEVTGLRTSLSDKEKEYLGKLDNMEFESAFAAGLSKVKFKPDLPASMVSLAVGSAKRTMRDDVYFTTEKASDGETDIQVVRSKATKDILRDPANKLEAYTPESYLRSMLKDALEPDRRQPGGGALGGLGGGQDSLDISSAKTQVEADEIIEKTLLKKGLLRHTDAFSDEFDKMRTDLKVSNLPLR